MRKKLAGCIASGGILAALLLGGCGSSGGGSIVDVSTNDKLFKSYSTGTYYTYDANGTRALKVTGKPFLAFRYLKSAPEQAVDCFFGFYDVTQQELIAGTAHQPELTAGDITYYPNYNFPNGTRIIRHFNFGPKNTFTDSNPIITVKESNTEWKFFVNNPSVKAVTRVTGQAFKTSNAGVDSEGGVFKAMDATPLQP